MLKRALQYILCLIIATQIGTTPGRRKGDLRQPPDIDSWKGKWFPFAHGEEPTTTTTMKNPQIYPTETDPKSEEILHHRHPAAENERWTGKWFPFPKGKPTKPTHEKQQNDVEVNTTTQIDLPMKWFPFKPANAANEAIKPYCDDGQHSIEIDFDPNNKQHSLRYLCLTSNRALFAPNLTVEAILEEQFIPHAFVPPVKCLNESITYEYMPSTFGAFRPVPPKYGQYLYLPAQRWLHGLFKGAIVMLYHPCANPAQIKLLRDTLQSCLYRHIITPSQTLEPQRPLALLAWGKILRMSVVDERRVVDFIKKYAKQGPTTLETDLDSKASYAVGLVQEAKLITDIKDTEICGYKEM